MAASQRVDDPLEREEVSRIGTPPHTFPVKNIYKNSL
jgi:hypothetical protein